jgi:hypothetical protein
MLMRHPEYGLKDVDRDQVEKHLNHGWLPVEKKRGRPSGKETTKDADAK